MQCCDRLTGERLVPPGNGRRVRPQAARRTRTVYLMATQLATHIVTFQLNGRPHAVTIAPLTTLRTALREDLHLHATKAGCGQGGCGSCTVLLDNELALSCLVPVTLVDGRSVTTLEGIGGPGRLHPLQDAFHDHFAAQCGYCTAAMIMPAPTSRWLL